MKILVTGATGLIGINLVQRLINDGYEVRILIRKSSRSWPLQNLKLEKAYGDITRPETLAAAVKDCEAVFHVAGYVNLSPFVRHHTERINVEGTRNVLAACVSAGVKRLVHTSSIAAIGHGSLEEPATEVSAWNFDWLHSPYTDSKRSGEELVLAATRSGAIDAVIVNPGYVIGAWDIRPTSGRMLLMISRKQVPFYPTGGISVAPVDAVAAGHLQALRQGKTGERYILGGDNITYQKMMSLMAEVAEVPAPRFALDPRWTRPVSKVGDVLGKFWPRSFADFNSNVMALGATHHYVSSEKARAKLNYQPTSARNAIQEAYDWFKEYRYI